MKKKISITILMMLLSFPVFSQKANKGEGFVPNGKPIINVFTDFRFAVQDGKTNAAFEITRGYLGYIYHFSPNFSSKVLMDVSTNNKGGTFPSAYTAFLKYAYGEYHNKVVTIDLGMMDTNLFVLQEALWSKRYVMKSFQDMNEYGYRADIGLGVKVQVTPKLSIDAQVLNGEGFQKVQSDSTVKVSAGITYEPIKHIILRLYADYMKKNVAQKTFSALIGYKDDNLTIAGEYNYQKGNKMIKEHNLSGISLYGIYRTNKNISVFGRYDYLTSASTSTDEHWNDTKNGQTYAAGIEFIPIKSIYISPNIQVFNPKSAAIKPTTSFLLSFNFNF